ncbi:hypothetical protein EVAR_92744_1 [Eumeta japonica]|uniref:Uncharacterized protein n=1 Tax=Eumeta variegata TaxID=151549 RepID=A0A4C1T0P5_EUMVA|nr:hypothetical protein EVAR_92744_1 [Eumeta japonica]
MRRSAHATSAETLPALVRFPRSASPATCSTCRGVFHKAQKENQTSISNSILRMFIQRTPNVTGGRRRVRSPAPLARLTFQDMTKRRREFSLCMKFLGRPESDDP